MADYCKQCSVEIFGEDFRELADLGDPAELEPGCGWWALCEGCGATVVAQDGTCIADDCAKLHGRTA